MIDVINLQRKIKLETAVFRRFVTEVLDSLEETNGKTFSVAFISDKRMIELNKMFRGKDSTTDVLSFPHESDDFEQLDGPSAQFLGDVVISVEQADKQAAENGLSLDTELKQLILHGVLHLCGYDHETDEGQMNARELELRERLCI